MSTQHAELFAALLAPFHERDVKTLSKGGKQIAYITARSVMNRLDDVLGPENWSDEYFASEHSVLCRLTITLPDGTRLTKCDAGGYAGMADQGDDDKSGFSDAFKRAAVKFGVGRYLYRDGVPSFVQGPTREQPQPAPKRPPAPAAAVSPVSAPEPDRPEPRKPPARPPGPETARLIDRTPADGRGLFRWLKSLEDLYDVGVTKYVTGWAKGQGIEGRILTFGPDDVARTVDEVRAKLAHVATSEFAKGQGGGVNGAA